MIHISIANHKYIRAVSFYYESSFPGLLEGTPSTDMISRRLNEARNISANSNTGLLSKFKERLKRSNHILYEANISLEEFPTYYCIADFESLDPTDKDSMFSYLTISWFMDLNDDENIQASAIKALKNFNWTKHAKNGNY